MIYGLSNAKEVNSMLLLMQLMLLMLLMTLKILIDLLIAAKIRLNQVLFCQSIAPEFLQDLSFLAPKMLLAQPCLDISIHPPSPTYSLRCNIRLRRHFFNESIRFHWMQRVVH